jgi:hypothetical protein
VAKWTLDKSERKQHDTGVETVTHEATVHLDADDPANLITLADLAVLVEALTSVDGIPDTATVNTTLDVALRWTEEP